MDELERLVQRVWLKTFTESYECSYLFYLNVSSGKEGQNCGGMQEQNCTSV